MIPAFLTLLLPSAAGWALVRLCLPRVNRRPAWTQAVLEISLGCGAGLGISSLLFFLLTWAGAASRITVLTAEAAAAGVAIAAMLRFRPAALDEDPAPKFAWTWVLRLAAVAALLLFFADFSVLKEANQYGGWDAFSIWNARAKFLAGGEATWRNAVSPDQGAGLFGASHPGYPLLLSGLVARTWMVLGNWTPDAPAAVALLFSLIALGTLFGALARARSEAVALLALLLLFATDYFLYQTAMQYSDIPLAFYLLGSLALIAATARREWPARVVMLAGLCAGLAAWTKNEGLVLLPFLFGLVLWRGRPRAAAWMLAGGAAPLLVTAAFKAFVAPAGAETLLPRTGAEAFAKLSDPSRWWTVASSFASSFWELGPSWLHPAILALVLAVALKLESKARQHWPLAIPIAGLLAADFVLYVTTTASDLKWAAATSNTRLLLQVWPAAILLLGLALRMPATESAAAVSRVPKSRSGRAK